MIRTVEQYLKSLDDGRVVYCLGERVKDVRTHPTIRSIIRCAAMDFALPNDPRFHDLFVTKNEDGEDVNFLLTTPRTSQDLLRRRECLVTGTRTGGGFLVHSMGIDALAACTLAASKMDKALGTHYVQRVEDYRKYVQKNDLALTGAMTDVKGDRSLHPSKQIQHKDFYVRVVDKQKDGIIVRGAKIHISATPCANEAIVLPCRTHGEEDKDYALSFAVPLGTKGVKLLGVEPVMRTYGEEAEWDFPHTSHMQPTECLIVFDDVFIPWEKVFMCQEWQYSRDITYGFASFHRLFGTCKMVGILERLTGAVRLIAEYNGLEKYEHVRNKLAWMAMITNNVLNLGEMSCMKPTRDEASGMMVPDLMLTNSAKFTFADNYHEMCKLATDICGGVATTVPSHRDWQNPELQGYIDKYLGGKAGIPTKDRIKVIRMIKDMTNNYYQTDHIHGEGSRAAQQIFLYMSADWQRYKAAALREVEIDGYQSHPIYGNLADPHKAVDPFMPPVDKSSKLFPGPK
jgi:4-hydroxybutyryl-CoA dehydratase / vinylacetyl-CoA-Delta-isomerase